MYTNSYSTQRQFNFVQRQLALFRQSWLIGAAAVFGLLLLISLVTAWYKPYNMRGVLDTYNTFMFLGGLVFTSQMFQELHASNRSYAFLTLPVSTSEKLIGAWLISFPLYILGFTLITFIIYVISGSIAGFPVSPLSYFSSDYLQTVANYWVVQTIFLWGACYFRKLNFLKTLLVLVLLPIVVGLFVGLIGWLLFGNATVQINDEATELMNVFKDVVAPVMQVLWYGVLGPYMLLTTYFTLKERQV